jgi:hypothetical protein
MAAFGSNPIGLTGFDGTRAHSGSRSSCKGLELRPCSAISIETWQENVRAGEDVF